MIRLAQLSGSKYLTSYAAPKGARSGWDRKIFNERQDQGPLAVGAMLLPGSSAPLQHGVQRDITLQLLPWLDFEPPSPLRGGPWRPADDAAPPSVWSPANGRRVGLVAWRLGDPPWRDAAGTHKERFGTRRP